MTHATTGRSAVARAVHVREFADGKVTALEALEDTHLMREAAGPMAGMNIPGMPKLF